MEEDKKEEIEIVKVTEELIKVKKFDLKLGRFKIFA